MNINPRKKKVLEAPPPPVVTIRPRRPVVEMPMPVSPALNFQPSPAPIVAAPPPAAALLPPDFLDLTGVRSPVDLTGATTPPPMAPPGRGSDMVRGIRAEERDRKVVDKNGRWKSLGINALRSIGESAQQVSQASMRSGRPVDEYGIAQVFGSGLGGGVAGAVRPELDEMYKQKKRMGELDTLLQEQLGVEALQDKRRDIERKILNDAEGMRLKGLQIAQTGEGVRLRSDDARARTLASMFNRLTEFDPNDAENAEVAEEMRKAGLPVFAKRANQKVELKVDPRSGSWRVFSANPQTGIASSSVVTDRTTNAPVVTATPQQMTAATATANRTAQDNRAADNRESQEWRTGANITSQERRAAMGGARGGAIPGEARRNRAAGMVMKLNDAIAKAQNAVTQRQRDALRKKANAVGQLIRAQYGDIVSDGDEGLPNRLNPQGAPSPNGGNGGGGRYAGQRFSRANIGTIRQRLGVSSDAEAERIITQHGGSFQ